MSLAPRPGLDGKVHRLIVSLAEILADREGTRYLKFSVTCGTDPAYTLVVEKRQKIDPLLFVD